ncbi:MAG: FAD-dependent oxidoreductase [Planctomycetes bacterium]|nr:FAD-dependent oxidoreductase [Planctomycetota bacterium]
MPLTPFAFPARRDRIDALRAAPFDVLVVGGGITGAGCAFDLSARGLKVALIERGDWASSTSSASSRLIHGGLRYLEHGEVGLVRESLRERAWMLAAAPGLVEREPFVFALRRGDRLRPTTVFLGLCAYTALALPRPLSWPALVSARSLARTVPGIDVAAIAGGASYADARTHDGRLTIAVVRSAVARGATCVSRLALTRVDRTEFGVGAHVDDRTTGESFVVVARAVVLAGGPSTEALRARAGLEGRWLAPTRGSHVVVARERLPISASVALLAPKDGRVMFLLRRERHTVIGTTDLDAKPDEPVRATRGEVRYLLDAANALVRDAVLTESDVIATWSGLRPLLASDERASARSREECITQEGPVWTIAGGKLTGFRSMAERLGARVCASLGRGDASARSPTRGLGLDVDSEPMDGPSVLDAATLQRLVATDDVYAPADVLWRRSDLGLDAPERVRQRIDDIARALRDLTGSGDAERAEAHAALEAQEAWRAGDR